MGNETVDRRILRLCIWMGPLMAVLFFVGFVLLAQFLPPPSPTDSAQQIATIYREHTDGIRFGSLFMMVGVSLLVPWGAAIAAVTRRAERGVPILNYVQLASVAVGTIIVVLLALVWAVAAFRPDEVSAQTTRTLNDLGWFLFLFDFSPFTIWCVAVGLAVLGDRRENPVFPRWVAYLSFWAGFLLVPAGMMAFFKTGAFAFNGLLAMYVPTFVFFIWEITLTTLVVRRA